MTPMCTSQQYGNTYRRQAKVLFTLSEDTNLEKHLRLLPFWLLWRLWKGRNKMVFSRKLIDIIETLRRAQSVTKYG